MTPVSKMNRFERIVRQIYESFKAGDIQLPETIVSQIQDALSEIEISIKQKYELTGKSIPHFSRTPLMEENLRIIVSSIRQIQEEGGNMNFVIFHAHKEKNYYIQIAAGYGNPVLYVEAVGNDVLSLENRLNNDKISILKSNGWNPPGGEFTTENFYRDDYDWVALDDEDRLIIAKEILHTFIEVYGFSSNQKIDVEVTLE